jgi:hypothetical protein
MWARFDRVDAALKGISASLAAIQKGNIAMAASLASLQAQVQKTTDVEASAILLIQGIAAQLAAAKEDPAAIQALADSLKAKTDDLAAAIVANTPVAPAE